MANNFNPTLRYILRYRNDPTDFGDISFGESGEELDGVKMLTGIPAAHIAEQREKFVIKPDDVFIATYPKCGTTWTQQIVKLIVNNGVETGIDVDVFIPWHELMSLDEIESVPSPRFFKSHLPYQLMPGGGNPENTKAKYICVIRNPKDTVVSRYNHCQKSLRSEDVPTWDVFFSMFVEGKMSYGSICSHFLSWWAHRDAPNILILTFEQMKRDPCTAVTSIANFLGYSLTDEVISKIVTDTSFDKMKDNKAANKDSVMADGGKFMHKGVIGNWRNTLTTEQSARIDAIVADKLEDSGLIFDYGDN